MVARRTSVRLAVGLTTGSVLASCAPSAQLDRPAMLVSSGSLRVVWVDCYATPPGVLVTGGVRRAPLTIGAISGHLHIEGRFSNGRPPIVVDTNWTGLPLRGTAPGYFRAVLPTDRPTDLASIRVEHRYERDDRPAPQRETRS